MHHIFLLTWIFYSPISPGYNDGIHTDYVEYKNRGACVKAANALDYAKGLRIRWWCKEKEGGY